MAKKKSTLSKKAADKLWSDFESLPPVLTSNQVDELETAAQSRAKGDGVARRVALATLSQPGAHLIKSFEKDRDAAVAFAAAARGIAGYREYLKGLDEALQAAEVRIRTALCVRDDMQDVIAEAEGHP